MKVLFDIFGFPIYFFGVMIALGILAGISISYKETRRKGLEPDIVYDLAIYGIGSAILGARVFYILFYNLSYYLNNPSEIIMISEGGLSIHGGLIGAFLFGLYYFRKKKLNFLKYADAIVPGIILGQAIGRVGCDVFGKVMKSSYPWGVERQGQLVHPTQVYEFLLNYMVFYLLWRKRRNIRYNGQLFVWYLVLFAFNRSIVEFFRYNPSIIEWFSISHLLSIGLILAAIIIGSLIKKKKNKSCDNNIKNDENISDNRLTWLKEFIYLIVLIIISLIIFYAIQS